MIDWTREQHEAAKDIEIAALKARVAELLPLNSGAWAKHMLLNRVLHDMLDNLELKEWAYSEIERIEAAAIAEIREKQKMIAYLCENLSEDETAIRTIAKEFFSEKAVEGDTYGVTPIVGVVEMLAAEIRRMKERLESLNATPNP